MPLKSRENRVRARRYFGYALSTLLTACAAERSPAATTSTAMPTPTARASSASPQQLAPEPSAALPVTSRLSARSYRCNLVIGFVPTAEWFEAGFEELLENARWQALVRPHTFVEDWADPGSPAWSAPLLSPCEERAAEPERVLFFAVDWHYKNENDWITGLTAAVNALRAHYPSAREIQLLTTLRAPGNVSCGDAKGVVEPFVDRAMDRVSAQFHTLVRVGPRFEVPTCDAFEKGGPHLSAQGKKLVAKLVADYYAGDL